MKFMKAIICSSLVISTTLIGFKPEELQDYTKDCLFAAACAAQIYTVDQLPAATRDFCQTIEKEAKKPFQNINKNDIKRILNAIAHNQRKAIYLTFEKEDKFIVLEGFWSALFHNENKDDTIKTIIDRILFLIFVGKPISDTLADIVLQHKDDVDFIRTVRVTLLNFNSVESQLKTRYTTLLNRVPHQLSREIKGAIEKRKGHYLRSYTPEQLETTIKKVIKERVVNNK